MQAFMQLFLRNFLLCQVTHLQLTHFGHLHSENFEGGILYYNIIYILYNNIDNYSVICYYSNPY